VGGKPTGRLLLLAWMCTMQLRQQLVMTWRAVGTSAGSHGGIRLTTGRTGASRTP
jgi:hypothetical protein